MYHTNDIFVRNDTLASLCATLQDENARRQQRYPTDLHTTTTTTTNTGKKLWTLKLIIRRFPCEIKLCKASTNTNNNCGQHHVFSTSKASAYEWFFIFEETPCMYVHVLLNTIYYYHTVWRRYLVMKVLKWWIGIDGKIFSNWVEVKHVATYTPCQSFTSYLFYLTYTYTYWYAYT